MRLNWIVIVAVAILSGCAFTQQAVVISPKVDVRESHVGADRAVSLNVVDERPRQTLGTRGVRAELASEHQGVKKKGDRHEATGREKNRRCTERLSSR